MKKEELLKKQNEIDEEIKNLWGKEASLKMRYLVNTKFLQV